MTPVHTPRLSFWARPVLLLGLLLGLFAVTGWQAVPRAHAATLTISTCNETTLDSAISSAANGDTLAFGCSGDILLTSTLTISKSLTLDGSGQSVTLDGQNQVQVLSMNSAMTLTLNALTVAHGSSLTGGGLFNNGGTVIISNSTFTNNSAITGGNDSSEFVGLGGGIYNNSGAVTISNSTFSGNSARVLGGGILNNGTLIISNNTFSGNSATGDTEFIGVGGGIYNNGTLTVGNSTFSGNSVGGLGGGISNRRMLTISNSTFSGNSANFEGGGIESDGTVTISNSTFANNSGGNEGGGIGNDATLTISNSTLSGNSASRGGGIFNSKTVTIGGSIVANNTGNNCAGGLSDQGYNLESSTDCGLLASTDLQNTNPQLGTLATNGGPTQTLALLSTSPAIDRLPAASCPATDGRGMTRPDNGETTCDIGAYEFTDPVDTDLALSKVPTNMTVDATSPQGATVTYTLPTVVDEDSPLPTATCTPASGSTFAIGATQVTCTVSDSDDTNSPVSASFTVTVNGAATQVRNLITTVNSFHLPPDFQASFDTQLQAVQNDLAANNTVQACQDLGSFINHVKAQSGKMLTVAQANQLITAARRVQAVLGC